MERCGAPHRGNYATLLFLVVRGTTLVDFFSAIKQALIKSKANPPAGLGG